VCVYVCLYDVSMCVIVCIQTGTGSVSCQRRPEVCIYVYVYDVSMCVIVCIQTGIDAQRCVYMWVCVLLVCVYVY
jgi:hypothetical protein